MDFSVIKELFRDKLDTSLYVPLFQKTEIDLTYAISEREKMILIYGDSGNGKSFLMKKIYENLKESNDFELYFISNPFEEEFDMDAIFKEDEWNRHRVLFVDEAQTLDEKKIERLRMYADNNSCTIILATHETEARYIFTKKHFKTRINYVINLKPLELDRLELFITSKFVQNNFYQVNSLFRKSNYKLIYKITNGNLREINRLMYKTFDVLDFFYKNHPQKLSKDKIDNKYIKIADMDLKGINA